LLRVQYKEQKRHKEEALVGFQGSELLSILARLSFAVPLALLPSLLYNAFDTMGWLHLASSDPRNFTFFQALRIHVSSEAVVKTIPLGAPLADSIKVLLLKGECTIAIAGGLSGAIYRRLYLGLTQGAYLVGGGLLGFSVLRAGATNPITPGYVEWIPIGTGVLLVIGLLLALILLSSPGVRLTVVLVCKRIPWSAVKERLVGLVGGSIANNRQSHAFFSRSSGMAFMWFLVYWCTEAVETLVFMLMLGIPVTVQQVAAIETVVSALRLAAFFLPSGIGIQDIGYAAMMASVGCVSAPGDASGFILLKRVKDIFWALLGYMFLVAKGIRPFRKSTLVQAS
jgi:hypothetical protein